MVDFLFALIELLCCLLQFWSYEAKCVHCTARLFSQGVDLFALRFYMDRVIPLSTILGTRKLETLGYPTVKPHPSAFHRFFTIPECDGQTGRICDRICGA